MAGYGKYLSLPKYFKVIFSIMMDLTSSLPFAIFCMAVRIDSRPMMKNRATNPDDIC